jgi:anti-sigma factor (TIGR02949 family)
MTSRVEIDCATALRLLAEFLDGELSEQAHEHVTHHLETCRSCFSRAEFERRLTEQLRALGREHVRPSFEQRIRDLVAAFATSTTNRERTHDQEERWSR